mmetsp:Transcript_34831/g.93016  ORF Transcript_34831/g.93016 Transcript_34831/m.93016 type:complete len:137 (+) Transcript_34831:100-510(+)
MCEMVVSRRVFFVLGRSVQDEEGLPRFAPVQRCFIVVFSSFCSGRWPNLPSSVALPILLLIEPERRASSVEMTCSFRGLVAPVIQSVSGSSGRRGVSSARGERVPRKESLNRLHSGDEEPPLVRAGCLHATRCNRS